MLIDAQCRILYLSDTVEGKRSDKKLAQEIGLDLPADSCVLQDLGFMGLDLPGVELLQPYKKKRGGKLSVFERLSNRVLSSSRVYVEHVFSAVKRFRSVREVVRMRIEGIEDDLMQICCGLHNLIVRLSPWKPMPEPGAPF